MSFPKVFEPFVQRSPVPVLARAILEYAFPPESLDALFEQHAVEQYRDELLFSTVFEIAALAVAGSRKSIHASYQSVQDKARVSVRAVYDKLQKTETQVSQALVRQSALRLTPVVEALGVVRAQPLPGVRIKILDGNHLAGSEHRLEETRRLHSQPLPGQALVVLDPQWMLMTDVFPCEDAYAQERSLLDQVLATVQPDECYVADRNFCTTDFLWGLARRQAYFVIRQHASTLHGKRLVGERTFVVERDGARIYEQAFEIDDPAMGDTMTLRHITIELDSPTRNDERELHLLSNLPVELATAEAIVTTYRGRWTIENGFQELGQALSSEISTLCYPKAALLCFCVGIVLYNTLSVMKTAIQAAHPESPALSGYYLAEELCAIYGGMMIAIAPRVWSKTFAKLTARQLATQLRTIAEKVNPARFRKQTRGPKKPPPPRKPNSLREKHVSTARILAARKK